MGVGDPDRPTPAHIVQAMHEAIDDPTTTIHPTKAQRFREAAVKWMERGLEWGWTHTEVVSLAPKRQSTTLFWLLWKQGTTLWFQIQATRVSHLHDFAGGEFHTMPLLSERGFYPT